MWRQNGRACWSVGGAGRLLESESESEPKLECQSRSVGAGVLKLECWSAGAGVLKPECRSQSVGVKMGCCFRMSEFELALDLEKLRF